MRSKPSHRPLPRSFRLALPAALILAADPAFAATSWATMVAFGAVAVTVLVGTASGIAYLLINRGWSGTADRLAKVLETTQADLRSRIQERDRMAETLSARERHYRLLLDRLTLVVFETDPNGRLTYLNAGFADMTGLPGDAGLGRALPTLFAESARPMVQTALARLLDGDLTEARLEVPMTVLDGPEILVELHLRPTGHGSDSAHRVHGTITDITARTAAESGRLDAETKYRQIFENALDGLYRAAPDGRILTANKAFAALYGLDSAEALLARPALPMERATDPAIRERLLALVAERGAVTGFQSQILRPDGTVLWISENVRAVRQDGALIYIEGIVEDITERKRAEAALRQAKDQSDLAIRSRSEFLANMSHELRTPLNAIIGFSEIIKDGLFGPVQPAAYQDYAVDIHGSGQNLLDLINDILDMSKIEAGQRELAESTLDLRRVIAGALRLIMPRAESAGLTIDSRIAPGLPFIRAEEQALKQILLNLLSNAVKFNRPDGKILIEASLEDDGRLRLSISDTGIGIAESDMPKVLSPFGQVETALSRSTAGAGLGLPLVRSLVTLHGGSFALESTKDIGTTATLWLPGERVLRHMQVVA